MLKNGKNDWHKQVLLTESINPVESMEEEKREPKKPNMTKVGDP